MSKESKKNRAAKDNNDTMLNEPTNTQALPMEYEVIS